MPRDLERRYDFNLFTDRKQIEKRRYIHRNPFTRDLVAHPKDWRWSSYRHWAYGEPSTVEIESTWKYERTMQQALHK